MRLRERRPRRAQHPRDDGRALRRPRRREPEPLAVARLRRDARLNDLLSPLFPAGFYYKTFMWPASLLDDSTSGSSAAPPAWARRAREPDPDRYEHRHAHCDVLVVGGGPAGLAAALAAGRAGARVILVDERAALGGSLRFESHDDRRRAGACPGPTAQRASSQALPDVRILTRTTAFGYYDHNVVGLVERTGDHLAAPAAHGARQRLWLVRAKRVVLATGAIERPLVFADNDLPGVMLASAVRALCQRVRRARRRDRGDLHQQRQRLCGRRRPRRAPGSRSRRWSIRARRRPPTWSVSHPRPASTFCPAMSCRAPSGAAGLAPSRWATRPGLPGASIATCWASPAAGLPLSICIPNPAASSATTARPRHSSPRQAKQNTVSVGAARGSFTLAECLSEGFDAGASLARDLGFSAGSAPRPAASEERYAVEPLWTVRKPRSGGKRFVDIQNDVTADDIALAHRENYHLGRASEALHHARHGHRPGQDQQRQRPCHHGGAARRGHSRGRHDDVPAALYAGRPSAPSPDRMSASISSRSAARRCTTGMSPTAR